MKKEEAKPKGEASFSKIEIRWSPVMLISFYCIHFLLSGLVHKGFLVFEGRLLIYLVPL